MLALSLSLTTFEQTKMRTTGPFSSLEEYHASSLRLILDLIVREEIYSQQAVDAYLIHRFLVDLVPLVLPLAQGNDDFYLKHAYDKGDHILVDEHFNVTGIIDWEWAHTASASHAFNSPIVLLPVAEFYGGNDCIGEDEAVFAPFSRSSRSNIGRRRLGMEGLEACCTEPLQG
jgi:hypothetical protein